MSPMLRRTWLKNRTPLERRTRLRARRPTPRRDGRIRDEPRLAWMRKLPCCCCGAERSSPHHSRHDDDGRPVGAGRKANDDRTMPMCWECHHELHDRAGRFWRWTEEATLAWENEQIAVWRAAYAAARDN